MLSDSNLDFKRIYPFRMFSSEASCKQCAVVVLGPHATCCKQMQLPAYRYFTFILVLVFTSTCIFVFCNFLFLPDIQHCPLNSAYRLVLFVLIVHINNIIIGVSVTQNSDMLLSGDESLYVLQGEKLKHSRGLLQKSLAQCSIRKTDDLY